LSWNIEGNAQMRRTAIVLRGYGKNVYPEISRIAKEQMDAVYEISQTLVPVKTGALKASGEAYQTEAGAGVRYNKDGSAPYAKRIEFDANLHHDDGQAFFIGTPFHELRQVIKEQFAQAAVAPLKNNGTR